MTTPTYEGRRLPHPEEPVFDQGLGFDIGTLLSRRRALRVFGVGAGALAAAACAGGTTGGTGADETASAAAESTDDATTGGDACGDIIPEETAGPYPGDGSNGPDVLAESGIVRRDITTSIGELSGTATGVPLEVELYIEDADSGCVPYAGAAVYLWHCDDQGRYSLYTEGVTDQNWLRGVQEADADGIVRFTTVFPGCYTGRWPHIHFEVFPSLATATDVANKVATSQIAFPEDICTEVYASTAGYEASPANLAGVTLASDNVFGEDAAALQLGTVSGSVADGLAIRLDVPVSAESTPVTDNLGGGAPGGGPGGQGGPPPGP